MKTVLHNGQKNDMHGQDSCSAVEKHYKVLAISQQLASGFDYK